MYAKSTKYDGSQTDKPDFYQVEVEPKDIPAPIKGWNAILPLANMPPEYAVTLDNWMPRPGWIELRGGANIWAQNLGTQAPVQSLMVYIPSISAERLFAAVGTTIFEVSNQSMPTVSKSSLIGTSIWQYVNYTPAGGSSYLVICNGLNATLNFDGTVWTTPTITGVSSTKFVHVHAHQRRLWFVENNSTRIWFLGTDAIAGAATALDIGSFLTLGSFVVATATWTLDGGNGPNALFVILTNKGQVVVYQGVDPTSATAWNLVGVFDLPNPVSGRRVLCKLDADVGIITVSGLLPLSKAMPFNPAAERQVALTNNIQNAMLLAAGVAANNFGWEVQTWEQQTMLIMNVPTVQNYQQVQYVMNALTGAWASFSGWNANCFAIYKNSLYYGDNTGNVFLAYTGKTDFLSPIIADAKCAFNFFKEPGRNKRISFVKPYVVLDTTVSPTISVDVDFGDNSPSAPLSIGTAVSGSWDVAIWNVSSWSVGIISSAVWQSVYALGTALALRIKINYGGSATSGVTTVGAFDFGTFNSAVFDGTGPTVSGQNLPIFQVVAFEALIEKGGSL